MFVWNSAEWCGKIKGKKKTHMEKIDKFGLLWVKIFTTLFILGFFLYDIFYVLTFWKALRPFCNDNIYDM